MNRKLNLTDYSDDGTTWSDYDGDYVYGDYTISGAMPGVTITEERSFQLGIGTVEDPAGTPTKEFFHPDLIGTTRHMTDVTGAKTASVVYTAFGERVTGTNHRYGYAGAHGYQTDDSGDSPFLHVGHRYYDPATGRFLQRDPVGIRGGVNVYAYVDGAPTATIDPLGLDSWWDATKRWGGEFWNGLKENWFSIVSELCVIATGQSVNSAFGPIGPVVEALEAGPDIYKIAEAKKLIRDSLKPGLDVNESLDKYDQDRDKRVKP
jgi:RHS repeat-associated protein